MGHGRWKALAVGCCALVASPGSPAKDPTLVYGVFTCKQGYVWREASAQDKVCVTPQLREETRRDNAQAAARRQPGGGAYGPDTCRQGFVWREATPNFTCQDCAPDHVCVTTAVRSRVRAENADTPQLRNKYQNALCAFGGMDGQDSIPWGNQCFGVPR